MVRRKEIFILAVAVASLALSCGKIADPVFDPSLSIPLLYQPADRSSVRGTSVDLSWTVVYEARDYDVRVARDSAFTDILVQKDHVTCMTAPVIQTISGLLPGSVYYWQARSRRTGCAVSAWTRFRRFTTAPEGP